MSKTYAKITTPLLALSEAEDYEEAKLEWRITGKVWRQTLYTNTYDNSDGIPTDLRRHPSGHHSFCLCGHPIVYHFEIENTVNKTKEIVGSTCIANWMILRHMNETLNMDKSIITEEMIEEWKSTTVQGLIKDAWWEENGAEFTDSFNHIKDYDLRLNVRNVGKKTVYDRTIGIYVPATMVRKRTEGVFGHPDYAMASIVWRWNHPQNTRAQNQSKRGYPDERLLNDLTLFHTTIDEHIDTYLHEHSSSVDDKELTNNIVKSVLIDRHNETFRKQMEYYGLPYFDSTTDSTTEWEKQFLVSIKTQVMLDRQLSQNQITSLMKILNRNNKTPTEAQTSYLTALGYTGTTPTTHIEISKLIDVWKIKRRKQLEE